MRILVVEDSERVATIVARALTTSGHVVLLASTRGAAIEELDRSKFDLAIIDVGLPDGSGLDVCRSARSGGYDLPAFEKLTTVKTWAEVGPPPGTLYHYPNPHNHQTLSIAASPAPPKIAQQVYTQATLTKMCVRHFQGEPMEKTLAWAESELEGFMRT